MYTVYGVYGVYVSLCYVNLSVYVRSMGVHVLHIIHLPYKYIDSKGIRKGGNWATLGKSIDN